MQPGKDVYDAAVRRMGLKDGNERRSRVFRGMGPISEGSSSARQRTPGRVSSHRCQAPARPPTMGA